MITVKDLEKVIFATNPNPLDYTVHVAVQCQYGFKQYSHAKDIQETALLRELTKVQDELLNEIVDRINKG